MTTKSSSNTGISAAIAAAGTQDRLAQQFGVSQQAVNKWRRQGWVPLVRAGQIEARYSIDRARLANPKLLALLGNCAAIKK